MRRGYNREKSEYLRRREVLATIYQFYMFEYDVLNSFRMFLLDVLYKKKRRYYLFAELAIYIRISPL